MTETEIRMKKARKYNNPQLPTLLRPTFPFQHKSLDITTVRCSILAAFSVLLWNKFVNATLKAGKIA